MTTRQKALAKEIVENTRPLGESMVKVGYSEATATHPKQIVEGAGFKELMEQYLSDEKLLDRHTQALDATKWNDFTGERELDFTTILKAIDLAHKLKGRNKDGLNVQGDLNMSVTIVRHTVE